MWYVEKEHTEVAGGAAVALALTLTQTGVWSCSHHYCLAPEESNQSSCEGKKAGTGTGGGQVGEQAEGGQAQGDGTSGKSGRGDRGMGQAACPQPLFSLTLLSLWQWQGGWI